VVVSKFEDRIKQAEHNLDSVIADQDIFEEKSPAIRAKTAIAEAKLLIEKEDYKAAFGKIVEVAELTKEAEEAVIQDEEAASKETEEIDESQDSEDQKNTEESKDSAADSSNNDKNATSAEPAGSADTKSDDTVGSGSR